MAKKIVGNPTVTPMAVPDWKQTDSSKADFIKNKPKILSEDDVIYIHRNHTYPVLRAEADQYGNKIHLIYARKDELQNNLNVVHDIVNLEGDAEIDAIPDARAVKLCVSYERNDVVGYVDRAIGDIETSLENIIEKYGLGGDSV